MTQQEAERLLALAREADFLGPDKEAWVERLSPERDAFEAAVRFFTDRGSHAQSAELAGSVWRLWALKGDIVAGRKLLSLALDKDDPPPSKARALALYGDGLLAFREGAQRESQERNEAALQVARTVGDRETESLALVGLSRVALREGDYGRVRSLALEARELARGLEPAAEVNPLHMLAAGTRLEGDLDDAIELYEQSLELNRRLDDSRMVGVELHNIGHVELHRGNIEAAERCFAECADLRSPNDPYDAAMTQLNRADMAFARGEADEALRALHECESILTAAGISLDPDDAFELEWLRGRLA